MLGDGDDQPELSQDEFLELSGEMKKLREEEQTSAHERA